MDDFVPYGDPLYYRLVAMRTVTNEKNDDEEIPSEPSKRIIASVVDVNNPEAPELSYTGDSGLNIIENVQLKWGKTAHNAIYRVFKLTTAGNWSLLHEIKRNNDEQLTYDVGNLDKVDDDGDTIYHRFKVDVENSSGLLNLETRELTI